MTICDFIGRPVDWIGNRRIGAWQLMSLDGETAHVRRIHDGAWAKIATSMIRIPVYVRRTHVFPTKLPAEAIDSVGNYSTTCGGYAGCTLAASVIRQANERAHAAGEEGR